MNEDLDILEKEILLAISRCFPFGFYTIKNVYQELKSFDKTIMALKMRLSTNVPLINIVENIKNLNNENL